MLVTPRTTEKSYAMAANNVYVFDVPLDASKAEVIAAIETQYEGVKIKDVRQLVTKGKAKAVNRGKRARPTTASRKDTKKAYVTVLEGKIEIAAFSEIDNQAKAEEAKSDRDPSPLAEQDGEGRPTSAKKAGLFAKKRSGRRGDK